MEQWLVYNKKADFKGIADKFGIDQVIARIIRNRDILEDQEIEKYLQGSRKDLYNPHLLKDADSLADILLKKIQEGKSIRIIGDYDIDGVMSSYILVTALERLHADVSVQIPHRIQDGYGLNQNIIEHAREDGIDTILTCDNGIAAINEIALAKQYGMTVLVTDHHEIPFEEKDGQKIYLTSEADAIVNPHQKECPYPYKELCGAAVAWKIVCILYEKENIPQEEAYAFIENVAFATIGDVVSLTDENRILVKEGLKALRNTQNIGMKALIEQSNIKEDTIDTFHIGFVLGPCINASGRLDTATRSLELFRCKDYGKAQKIASELVFLNEERKELTLKGVDMAHKMYLDEGYDKDKVLVIYLPEMHESVAGIIAGRIREAYHKPTFVLTKGEEGIKGSGRSIEEYSMFEEMNACKEDLLKFGGHPMAAGLSLLEENIDAFREHMNANCKLTEEDLQEKIHIDVPMPVDYATMDLVEQLRCLAPFGKDNPKPVFADRNIRIKSMKRIGKSSNVLKLQLRTAGGREIPGIFFKDVDKFENYLIEEYGEHEVSMAYNGRENNINLSIIYTPKINVYRETATLQCEIDSYK